MLVIVLLYLGLFLSFNRAKKISELVPYRSGLIVSSWAVIIGTYLFVSLALYLAFNEVGNTTVSGISGRYFLPLFPLLLVIPLTARVKFKAEKLSFSLLIVTAIAAGLVSTYLSLG